MSNLYYAKDVRKEMSEVMLKEIYRIIFDEGNDSNVITPIEKLIAIKSMFILAQALDIKLIGNDEKEDA